MANDYTELYKHEGWKVDQHQGKSVIELYGELFPLVHPLSIHLKLYRTGKTLDIKFNHLKKAHDLLWSNVVVWHYWTERLFQEHLTGVESLVLSGGASTGKSDSVGRLVILFWWSNPALRAALVASTTLASLKSRIWGYIRYYLKNANLKLTYHYTGSPTPKILYDKQDDLHGMFALAAAKGTEGKENSAIKNYIGRHPKDGLMVILDECTDLDPTILDSIPNLASGQEFFQVIGIGNSLSRYDLHGAMATPADGWKSVNPDTSTKWKTHMGGTCLYFNCYESPAIHEQDPIRKLKLSKFLITEDKIIAAKEKYGDDSLAFYRFILGFWQSGDVDPVIISEKFAANFNLEEKAEWSGLYPLQMYAGLDPAFTQGGDDCLLQLGVVGHEVSGQMVIDFRKEELQFKIPLSVSSSSSMEIQIADFVIKVLLRFGITLDRLCVDSTGQGRAIAEVIRLRMGSMASPIKIYSTQLGKKGRQENDLYIKTSLELWRDVRNLVQYDQLRGVGYMAIKQLTSRLVIKKGSKEVLESKKEYKQRMGSISPLLSKSPDEADSIALCIQAAMIAGGLKTGELRDVNLIQSQYQRNKSLLQMQNKSTGKASINIGHGFTTGLEEYVKLRRPF